MRSRFIRTGIPLLLTLTAGVLAGVRPTHAADSPMGSPGRGPVLIELFTSQGCSSCPPADRLLTRLAQDPELGEGVIALAFHVDYWNRLGWKDPFSAASWSARQREYAARIPGESVYTPQLVIDGRFACVGSDERKARQLIRAAQSHPVEATLHVESATLADHAIALSLRVRLERPPRESPILYAAVFSSGQTTQVTAGENARRTLHDDYVVLSVSPVATIERSGDQQVTARVDLNGGLASNASGIALFLQDPITRHVLASDRIHLDSR